MTDRASAEGLRALADRWEAEGQRRDADPTRHQDPVNVLAAGIYHEHAEALRAALRDTGSGIDEDVLRQMVERPMTSAYFEDFNAGRLDSEQVARALAGDYAVLSTPRTETEGLRPGEAEALRAWAQAVGHEQRDMIERLLRDTGSRPDSGIDVVLLEDVAVEYADGTHDGLLSGTTVRLSTPRTDNTWKPSAAGHMFGNDPRD